MNLDDALYYCLSQFTNPNNNIRQEAEKEYNTLIETNSIDLILTSLINIIKQYVPVSVSFSALIQLKKLTVDSMITKTLDDSFYVNIRNEILQFFIDPKFSPNMHQYILEFILMFFAFSFFPKGIQFPEIWPFLEKIFQIPDFYRDVLKMYCNLLKYPHPPDVFNFYDERNNMFILSHLDPSFVQEDRSATLVFFLEFYDIYSPLLSSFDILSLIDEFGESCFQNSISSFIKIYIDDKISINAKNLYDIMFLRIMDENNSEIFRQFLLYHISYLICFKKEFYNYVFSNLPNFIEIIVKITSKPHIYPIVYMESKQLFSSLMHVLVDSSSLLYILSKNIECTNYYTSSLFLRYTIFPIHLQRGLFYANHEDQLIRENGLIYIRRLIKTQIKNLYSISNQIVEGIATYLIDSYVKYKDPLTLKALTVWCVNVHLDTLSIFSESIMNLCKNILLYETIECGATLLRLLNEEQKSDFSLFLVQGIHQLLSANYVQLNSNNSLRTLMDFIPIIMKSLNDDMKVELMHFLIPYICEDNDSLFSKGMGRICNILQKNINSFEAPILQKVLMAYNDAIRTGDSILLTKFLEGITSYCFLFANFESNYLPLFIEICINIINDKDSFSEDCIPDAARGIAKAVKYYSTNENLFRSLFEPSFSFILNDDSVLNINFYLKIIKAITKSKFFEVNEALFTLNNFKTLFDHCVKLIIDMKNAIQQTNSMEYRSVFKIPISFSTIFSSLLQICESQSVQLIVTNFLNLNTYPTQMQIGLVNIYFEILTNIDLNIEILQQILQMLVEIISMMPLQQEQYDQFIQSFVGNEIEYFIILQKNIIDGFGNLLYSQQISIDIVNKLFEYSFQLFSIQDQTNLFLLSLQNSCFSCVIKLFYRYRLVVDQNNLLEFKNAINTLFQIIPRCQSINDLTFKCIFQIILFCISSNIFQSEELQILMNYACQSIKENKVDDVVLRDIKKIYTNSDIQDIIRPILNEIENFLSE